MTENTSDCISRARSLKDEGNVYLTSTRIYDAITKYSEALELLQADDLKTTLDPSLSAIILSNRAFSYIKIVSFFLDE